MKTIFLLPLLWLFVSQAMAQLSMPNFFSDHMVLQAEKPIKLWGKADPGAEVEVVFGDARESVRAADDGRWALELAASVADSEGRTLSVRSGEEVLTFEDVLIGEVWFASGQSNMEWRIKQLGPFKDETLVGTNHPKIRHLTVPFTARGEPQDNVGATWKVCSPETADNFSAVGYFFARKLHEELNVPVGIIVSAWGGKRVETFTRREALLDIPYAKRMVDEQDAAIKAYDPEVAQKNLEKAMVEYEAALAQWRNTAEADRGKKPRKPRIETHPGRKPSGPGNLWNGMIHPFVGLSIRGVLWYQGESNARSVEDAEAYGPMFMAKIKDWRQQWGEDFHYLFVQLANFKAPVEGPGTNSPWAIVQDQQRQALRLPGTGMAVANDIGEEKDIHPRNKHDVGERLARWALADAYGFEVVRSGPLFSGAQSHGAKVFVTFDHIGSGLKTRDGGPLGHFELRDTAGQWHWAQAKIHEDAVVISHPEVEQPSAVRYAWAENPESANLVNSEGLPASIFSAELR